MDCGNCGTTIADPPGECPECGQSVADDAPDPVAWLVAERSPIGIKLICLIELLGILVLFDTAGNLLAAARISGDSFVHVLGLCIAGFAALNVVKVVGLWTLRTWGYKLATGLYALGVVLGALMIFVAPSTGIVSIIVYGALWAYVHSKRRFFGVY